MEDTPITTLIARLALPTLIAAALAGGSTRAAEATSEQDAHAIGVQAYLYFYPLITMDLTRKQFTNVAKPEGAYGPMNTFANILEYPPADLKVVVRPNFDTLSCPRRGWRSGNRGPRSRPGCI